MAMRERNATPVVDLNALADAQLVQLARQRDSGAFRTVMQRHNRRLYRLARAVVRNDSEAEDVVQEAYVRAFTSLDRFRGDASLATWLSRIVLNEALGRLRRRHPTVDLAAVENRQPSQGQVIPFPLATSQLDPERTMAQREIQRLLEQAIDDLPEAFRTVLVARVIEEMSVKETADLFGLREETVKTRLHRARSLLKKALEKHVDSVLTDAFPFDGRRCERMASAVLQRFGLPL
jgi:RNA polymerase sigma-70 factor (ECF subfamily)